ncbi:MAG TPA: iron ABC transporter permease [Myxococcota bacterium]|nr:iron ABC transporter permease [Myxococcota bacterium]HRY92942.1 iron ABC transporter permease [Myxococcota bacterium]HSA19839.1 iron ABC transporter permease [Myxococcota bacterium]
MPTAPVTGPRSLTARRFLLVNACLLLLLVASLAAGALLGPGGTDFGRLLPLDPDTNSAAATLLLYRLPRALLAALVGMALAAVGVAFQALLRNPLADPFIMGVSGGAALGGTLALALLGGSLGFGLALEGPAAFLGALLATLLVYWMGRVAGRVDTTTVLLVGVVFNAFASAVIMFLESTLAATKTQEILVWLMGCLGYPEYATLAALGAVTLPGVLGLWALSARMNALALGEQGASHLGVDVERTKRWVFGLASLLVGLAVAVSGMIGFVGLIVPHLCRLVLGPDHRLLLPAAALAGASFLVLADLIARLLFVWLGSEPPVGAVTAFLGGPFFLLLLRRRAGQVGSN